MFNIARYEIIPSKNSKLFRGELEIYILSATLLFIWSTHLFLETWYRSIDAQADEYTALIGGFSLILSIIFSI